MNYVEPNLASLEISFRGDKPLAVTIAKCTMESLQATIDALRAENTALRAHVALLTGKPEAPQPMGEVMQRILFHDSYWTGA